MVLKRGEHEILEMIVSGTPETARTAEQAAVG